MSSQIDFSVLYEADFYRPLFSHLSSQKKVLSKPLRLRFLSFYHLMRLALFYKEIQEEEKAHLLASELLSLEKFPTLWTRQEEFDEVLFKKLFSRLKTFASIASSPTFPNFSLLKTPKMEGVFTLNGRKTSLGAIRAAREIRAFGPQDRSLTFGIEGSATDGWTRASADLNVWLSMKTKEEKEGILIDFHFVGINPSHPLFLAFYIKADTCRVGDTLLTPKSLKKHQSKALEVSFDDKLLLQSKNSPSLEVIPLAGKGAFWDSDFLVCFEICPISFEHSFLIQNINS